MRRWQRIGGTDVASVAYAGGHSHTQVPYTMVPIKLFNPKLFIPNHHDEGNYDMNMEELFQAIRDEMPGAVLFPLCTMNPSVLTLRATLPQKYLQWETYGSIT